ncbi:MAG TPA: TAT-variant-translocated molybdopterin oxidoreductase [Blastocatellia bacterium]|nr:TAT-variant-translocated molybdopterin oxidoreductase [Blastocatellia bacterium]
MNKGNDLDLTSITSRVKASSGKEYWRSLEELADTDEFQELLHREFPQQASEFTDPVGRRRFLKLMGASLALAGLTACTRQPTEIITPYARQPEGIVPGRPLFYATAMPLDGVGTGLLVESHEGRPTKIEGNPDHPSSLGATDVFAQAAILSLYDPDRSQTLTYLGDIQPWSAFLGAIRPVLSAQMPLGGAGVRILTETVTSPTLASQLRSILDDFPSAKWHQYDPVGGAGAREGGRAAFGQYVNTIYDFEKADVILSLDSDFLHCGPATLRYSRQFASRRRVSGEGGEKPMNRLYAVESSPTLTGAKADHKIPLRPSQVEAFTRALASGLGVQGVQASSVEGVPGEWIPAVVKDLQQHRGASLVVAGEFQPPVIHALAHAMNQALGNVGNTVVYTDPVEANPVDDIASLRELVDDINTGQVDLLIIVGGNPVYSAPADLNFDLELLRKARLRVHMGLYKDETAELCQWHIPQAHFLESWSDVRAFDGTVSIIQPLISPLYYGKTAHELLAAFSDRPEQTSHEIVRDYWRGQMGAVRGGSWRPPAFASPAGQANTNQANTNQAPGAGLGAPAAGTPQPARPNNQSGNQSADQSDAQPEGAASASATAEFEKFWRKVLHDGLIANTQLPTRTSAPNVAQALQAAQPAQAGGDFEIVFRPDSTVYDGRFANNGWLQELPKHLTKLTWDNAALLSPATASRLGVGTKIGSRSGEIYSDQVELDYNGRKVVAPVMVVPGHPDNTVTVHLGYGRRTVGRVGAGAGFNANLLRTSNAPWFGAGVRVNPRGETMMLAVTQMHHMIDPEVVGDRELVKSQSLSQFQAQGEGGQEDGHAILEDRRHYSLYPEYEYRENRWGMAIDLSTCTGCSACVVACQSENNIPVVGKEEVAKGREMHWLRVDTYYRGPQENPDTFFQPVPCMHCEKAPCEVVCPVAATVHSEEGLNDMIYNRCVGTRYCSNNCPYKVRRFNFFLYQDWETPTLKMMRNPDVTVRSRGVMEKCTYCVQRISKARIDAQKEDRPIRDGEVVTACQSACPADAIVFGNMSDPGSRVSKLKRDRRNYALLDELNTQPRTTYLSDVRNPNPELEKA